jgi:hypothetical protein
VDNEIKHVGVLGMHWGQHNSGSSSSGGGKSKSSKPKETPMQRLVREAHPKKWSTAGKVAYGVGVGAGILLTPWPVGLTVAVASSAYLGHRAETQHRAQLALAKINKTKIKNLPKKSAYEDLQDGLKSLEKSGKGNNDAAAIALSVKYDKARKAEKQLYGANAPKD